MQEAEKASVTHEDNMPTTGGCNKIQEQPDHSCKMVPEPEADPVAFEYQTKKIEEVPLTREEKIQKKSDAYCYEISKGEANAVVHEGGNIQTRRQ